jgi:hypothetical protein
LGGGEAAIVHFAGEEEEDGLGDIVGEVGVADLAEGGGVDEVDVGGDEGLEGESGHALVSPVGGVS